jgi:hypothetical protein
MFDRKLWLGLATRLANKMVATYGAAANKNPTISFIAYSVAAVNYPKGADAGIEYLPPKIPQKEISRVTENFLDKGVGSIDDLFLAIWGLRVEEYLREIAMSGEDKP